MNTLLTAILKFCTTNQLFKTFQRVLSIFNGFMTVVYNFLQHNGKFFFLIVSVCFISMRIRVQKRAKRLTVSLNALFLGAKFTFFKIWAGLTMNLTNSIG